MRKISPFFMLLALCGCSADAMEPTGALVAASVAAVPVFGRTLPDMVYSAATGKDCSMVRLEQGRSYCREMDPPLAPPMVCSRSLGVMDCWKNPEAFPVMPHAVADAPAPTAEQEAYRTRRWPSLW
jgi:hypothetical protein